MPARRFRVVLRCIGGAILLAASVYGGLAAYCVKEINSFYGAAQRLDGTIVGQSLLPGGNAPVVEFVDDAGLRHVEQLGPFYATDADEVGELRTVLYNPTHDIRCALESPWNWLGAIVYGSATVGLIFVASVFFLFTQAAYSLPQSQASNGA